MISRVSQEQQQKNKTTSKLTSYIKGQNQQNKKALTQWERIFANYICDKRLMFRIYKELL